MGCAKSRMAAVHEPDALNSLADGRAHDAGIAAPLVENTGPVAPVPSSPDDMPTPSPAAQAARNGATGGHQDAPRHESARRPTAPPATIAANARVVVAAGNAVAQRHAKLCMDPSTLVRKGEFGSIELFDCQIEEQLGCMDVKSLRGIYAEHCLSPDSHKVFSPPNNPSLSCTPEEEFFFVVGKDGINQEKWELNPGARPASYPGCMVAGRNATTIAELLGRPEAAKAGLRTDELMAIRMYSGPMYAVYNPILRSTLALDPTGSTITDNQYPTTIQLIVSGICKLCRVAEVPAELAVFRGLSGMALPKEFFELDEQGFAGGVEASFMSTTVDEQVLCVDQ